MIRRLPIIGFLGIHSGGRDQPPSQNEILANLFEQEGYEVRRASAVKAPSLRTAHQIASVLSWHDVDVLVVAVFSGPSFWIAEIGTTLGRLTGKRVVLFLHGGNLPVFAPAHRTWTLRVLQRADVVLAPSDYLAEQFRAWGIDVRVIPNVLHIERYVMRDDVPPAPRLLWMRTFAPEYEPEMAVRVLGRVLEQHPDAHLTMAGQDQGWLDHTKGVVAELGLEGHVTFAGFLDAAGKRAAFAANDIYLNTNQIDNMPVSLLEAAASGLVPVATAVGGIPKLVTDGVDGLLTPVGDDEAMAKLVVGLLADPDGYHHMSLAARRLAEESAWPAVFNRWEEELSMSFPDMAPHRRAASAPDRPSPVVRPAGVADLDTIARLHVHAFPDSVLGRLGVEAVRRSYQWQLDGPHDVTALIALDGDRVAGFLFGGVFRGSMIGYLKREKWFLVRQVARHPWIFGRRVGWDRLGLSIKLLARRRAAAVQPEEPASVPRRSFGVLAIAVDPSAQRMGVGRVLMAEAEAQARAGGFTAMHLTVHPENRGAADFYRNGGWVEVPGADGRWEGRMSLSLVDPD